MLHVTVQQGPARCHQQRLSAYKTRPKMASSPPARAGVPYAAKLAAAPVGEAEAELAPVLDGELPLPEVRLAPPEPEDEAPPLLPPALVPSVVRLPH